MDKRRSVPRYGRVAEWFKALVLTTTRKGVGCRRHPKGVARQNGTRQNWRKLVAEDAVLRGMEGWPSGLRL